MNGWAPAFAGVTEKGAGGDGIKSAGMTEIILLLGQPRLWPNLLTDRSRNAVKFPPLGLTLAVVDDKIYAQPRVDRRSFRGRKMAG